jgi:DNA-binding Lrp family transcriptional regulator
VELAAALGVNEDEVVSRMMRLQEEGLVALVPVPEGLN